MLEELPSVFIVGPMGAGKTTIGRLLAKQLGRKFVDSDWYIESQTGADIAWIFSKEGEPGFRERETKAIDELTLQPQIVLATGGGAVMRAENRQLLQQRGMAEIFERLRLLLQTQQGAKSAVNHHYAAVGVL